MDPRGLGRRSPRVRCYNVRIPRRKAPFPLFPQRVLMVRSSPEKLAAALRANLKRRKPALAPKASKPGSERAVEGAKKPPKTSS